MNKRSDWTFPYTREDLKNAAKRRQDYHIERHEHWISEREKAEVQIREKGVELRERHVTGGASMEAVVDMELGKHLTTCRDKVAKHHRMKNEFARWVRAFQQDDPSLVDDVYLLTVDDIEYFGL